VLAIVALSFGGLALAGGITGVILWLTADMRETTHKFLGDLRAGRDDDAYAMTTASFQSRVPRAAFSSYVDARSRGLRASQSEWINGSSGGIGRACMEVWVDDHGDDTTLYVLIEKERGEWRVDDLTESAIPECDDD
jgi:hypothetical protein